MTTRVQNIHREPPRLLTLGPKACHFVKLHRAIYQSLTQSSLQVVASV